MILAWPARALPKAGMTDGTVAPQPVRSAYRRAYRLGNPPNPEAPMTRKRTSPLLLTALLPLLLTLAACQPTATPAATVAHEPDLVARGEYLVRIGGCNDCHTPGYAENGGQTDKADWLTGSPLGYHGPWGTTYPTNLRLRLQEMSEAQWMDFSANLRTRPPMPDFTIRAMADQDRRAIYRFVHSLGGAGKPASDALPPGQTPPPPVFTLVLPAMPAADVNTGAKP